MSGNKETMIDSQGFEYKDLEINHPAVKESRIYNFAMTKEQMLKLQKEMNDENPTKNIWNRNNNPSG